MADRITCPSCKTSYPIKDEFRGKKVRCAKCKEQISVPAAAPVNGAGVHGPSEAPHAGTCAS